jgi:hypothetical protein
MTVENNQTNRDELIEEVLEVWEMDELLAYAKQQLNKEYKDSTNLFESDWEGTFSDDEES